ncbi:MAG: DNA mismatch repair endonuclease MutL [Sporolactobacillus sp.]
MGMIRRLAPSLANKIAAGEVVERPASVVKELVENAIDAGAIHVTIDVTEAGLAAIRVTDNGSGFAPDDCAIAFERHATSKIHGDADLFHIQTLGFRGEALPSIAAVSYIDLKTSDGEHAGNHLVLQGGHLIQSGHTQSRKGTELTVSRLFYNTPARLKYLKSAHTELGKITDVVNRIALAYPGVRLLLRSEGRQVFATNGSGEISHVLAAIYGVRTARAALPFSAHSLDFRISGMAVHPQISRAGRQYVYIIVNRRFIVNYPIFNAIMAGYHTLLMIGRYPICVIHVEMEPSLIDVNVHPSKLEARISKEQDLCALITQTLRATFHREQLIPDITSKAPSGRQPVNEQQSLHFLANTVQKPEDAPTVMPTHSAEDARQTEEVTLEESQQTRVYENNASFSVPEAPINDKETVSSERVAAQTATSNRRIPTLYPIGQMHGTYIFAQNEDGLYIIDQHAAQERINYEYYREKVGETTHDVQPMLVPLTFELNQADYSTVIAYHDYLASIGLDFESFGDHTLIVRGHPAWMPSGQEEQSIHDIVDQLIASGRISIKQLREKLAIMMACKRAIKANHYLREDEITALLDHLAMSEDPFTCPHGRPVMVHFSVYEMEKMFKRVQ